MKRNPAILSCLLTLAAASHSAHAFNIMVDYSYDSNDFFDQAMSKAAMQAAADRFSAVITSNLAAVGPSGTGTGTSADWRIGFTHPGTGQMNYQLSTAASFGADALSGDGAADEYGFAGLSADTWTLYAGGRTLAPAGQGGTGTGLNFTGTLNDINGPMHRGFNDNTPSNTVNDLPRWGGSISFDSGTTWNFDLGTTNTGVKTDFYSIALHEVGHALGLGSSWNQWMDDGDGGYTGPQALAAYNTDNGTSLASLDLVSPSNDHWENGTYESFLFPGGIADGTVSDITKQDLLMEPTANFVVGSLDRFELTNTDVGALQDLGWSVVPEPSAALLTILGLGATLVRRRR